MSICKTLQTWIAGPHRDTLPYPKFLQLESEDLTDFGQQVVTLMQMKPDSFIVLPSLRDFAHPSLGTFAIDKDGHVHHSPEKTPGALIEPGKQRLLTRGDSGEIAKALHWLLRRPMSMDEPKLTAGGATAQVKSAYSQTAIPGLVVGAPPNLMAARLANLEAQARSMQGSLGSGLGAMGQNMADAMRYAMVNADNKAGKTNSDK